VTALLRDENELVIRCRALDAELRVRRPRPRWRAGIVAEQQLRWFRTTLLGRMPAWSPPAAPVGPWRPITLEARGDLGVDVADVRARLEGKDGVIDAVLRVRAPHGTTAVLVDLRAGDAQTKLACAPDANGVMEARGTLRVPNASLWWPHTHGAQPLYDVAATIDAKGERVTVDLGRTGFRAIEAIDAKTRDGFGVRVNGVDVFCRGACWTPLDVVSLTSTPALLRAELLRVRAAGMNMLRVSGTMVYEDDAFHALCDELGILVWQDLMFASLDYPAADEAFLASARREASELADRLQLSPSLAVVCGASEYEQRPAMFGAPREQWKSALFEEVLPREIHARRDDALYVSSSPTGGAMPFHTDARVTQYFGVGAYMRPFEDARRANVRFAAECLAFANVPDDETIESLLRDGEAPPHHPAWKARVPRDRGASGWDFDDVRDHYVSLLFGVDPARVRYADVARYLALGRVATGEAMARTFGEWRRRGSSCRGALVWLYRDLWPGAGWGVVDANGLPKSAYFFLRRALAPIAMHVSDEGLNGIELHAFNESERTIDAELRVALIRGEANTAEAVFAIELPARGNVAVRADAILPHFADTTYAYRFGPPGFEVARATLVDRKAGIRLADARYFPGELPSSQRSDLGVEAIATPRERDDGAFDLAVRAKRFALAVAIDARGFDRDDDFFDVAPGETRHIVLRPRASNAKLVGSVLALNADAPARIAVTAKT
jgi:beta-mannosidase